MSKEILSTRIIWQCPICEDVVISYSHIRYDMNFCECRKTAMDLEEHYARYQGTPKTLSIKTASMDEDGYTVVWTRIKTDNEDSTAK